MGIDTVCANVLDQVKPGREQREDVEEVVSHIVDVIEDRFDVEADVMGSVAKNTELAEDIDLDIFVFFNPSTGEDRLEKKGLEIGEAVFNEFGGEHHVEYADHPYTKGVIQGFDVEIVPAYRLEDTYKIQSAVDRTPFHKQWINQALSQKEKDEVRLLKAFLKGQDLYGSTLKIQGFSGYLCEVLVAAYSSFQHVLEAAMEWKRQPVLDPGNHYNGNALPNYALDKMGDDPLIVVDPVDKERNVAAVLTEENLAQFIHAAWQFLDNPNEHFFFPPEPDLNPDTVVNALQDWGQWIILTFTAPDTIDDILHPQLRKLKRRLTTMLHDNDFTTCFTGTHVDEETGTVRIPFCFTATHLPKKKKQYGPQVYHNTNHLQNFTDKYNRVWIEDDRLVTMVTRDHQTPHDALDAFLSGDLQAKGVPENLVPHVADASLTTELPRTPRSWINFLAAAGGFT